jgi:hypothetical protein
MVVNHTNKRVNIVSNTVGRRSKKQGGLLGCCGCRVVADAVIFILVPEC